MPKKQLTESEQTLKNWMEEFFPFTELKKLGLFTKEMKGDYPAQAARVCEWMGMESIYEWGNEEIVCHLSFAGKRPLDEEGNPEPFITVIPSIWDE